MQLPSFLRGFENPTEGRTFNVEELKNVLTEGKEDEEKRRIIEQIEQITLSAEEIIRLSETKLNDLRSEILAKRYENIKKILEENKVKKDAITDLTQLQLRFEKAKEKIPFLSTINNAPPWLKKAALGISGIFLGFGAWFFGLFDGISAWFGKDNPFKDRLNKIKFFQNLLEGKGNIAETIRGSVGEGGTGALEKLGALGAAGLVVTSLFGLVKTVVPANTISRINQSDAGDIARGIGGRKMLKLFLGGSALAGASALFLFCQQNPEKVAALGSIPGDTIGKKEWWGKLLDMAKVGVKEGKELLVNIFSGTVNIANGEMLRRHLEAKGREENKIYLKDSKFVEKVGDKISIIEGKIENIFRKDPEGCWAILGLAFVAQPTRTAIMNMPRPSVGILRLMLNKSWGKVTDVARGIREHPLQSALTGCLAGVGIVGMINTWEYIKHIQINEKNDTDVAEMFDCMTDLDEFSQKLHEMFPDADKFSPAGAALAIVDGGDFICDKLDEFWETVPQQLSVATRNALEIEDNERISGANKRGLKAFQNEIAILARERNKKGVFVPLLGEDFESGVVGELLKKSSEHIPLNQDDIGKLIRAALGTGISIFAEGVYQDGAYIQWVDAENPQYPKNICVNPSMSGLNQLSAAKHFFYDLNITSNAERVRMVLGKFKEGSQDILSDLVKSWNTNPERSKSILQYLIGEKMGSLVGFGSRLYFYDYLGNKWYLGPKEVLGGLAIGFASGNQVTVNEALVSYGEGLAPVLFITAIKGAFAKFIGIDVGLGRVLAETAAYPFTAVRDIWRQGKFIGDRVRAGKIAQIFMDPLIMIRDSVLGVQKNIPHLEEMRKAGKLRVVGARLRKVRWLKGIGKIEDAEELLRSCDTILKNEKLPYNMTLNELDTLIDAVDKHIMDNGKLGKIIQALHNIKNGNQGIIEKIINKLKFDPLKWQQAFNFFDEINHGAGAATFAWMAYQLETAEDKKEVAIQQMTGLTLFYLGYKTTKTSSGLAMGGVGISKIKRAAQEVLGLAGGVASLIFGEEKFMNFVEGITERTNTLLGTGDFSQAVWNQSGKALGHLEFLLVNRALMQGVLGKTFYDIIDRKVLESVSSTTFKEFCRVLESKAATKIVGEFMKKLGEKLSLMISTRIAAAAGATWIPVAGEIIDAGLILWTAWDCGEIYEKWAMAMEVKKASEEQEKKGIQSVVFDEKGEQSIRDMVTEKEPSIKYDSLDEKDKNARRMKYFKDIASCVITVVRTDGSEEIYGYINGEPTYIKIKDIDSGKMVQLTQEDLAKITEWKVPSDYKKREIPYETFQEAGLMQVYAFEIQRLRNATKWQQLDAKIESGNKITISRRDFTGDKLIFEREQPGNMWKISSENTGIILPGKYDFHGGLALAGLALFSMEFLKKQIHEKRSKDWQSEDGTRAPFSVDGDSIRYAKNNALNKKFIGEKWLPFYENNLKLSGSVIANVLNTYFGTLAERLDLLGK